MGSVYAGKPNVSWTACYDTNMPLSEGYFLGDNPLNFSLPLLMLEISMIFISYTGINHLLRPLGQSRIVSQILTGILFGRSVIGRSFFFRSNMFPVRGILILDTISLLSFVLFLFSTGVKTDLGQLKKSGKRAVVIGVASSVLPFALSMGIYNVFKSSFPAELTKFDLIFQLALRLSLSSFVVVADTLDELGLLNSELGRLTMSATLVTDTVNVLSGSIILAKNLNIPGIPNTIWWILAPLVITLLVILLIARPITNLQIKKTPPGELLHEGAFVGVILWAIFAGWATESFGYHFTLGPFVLGMVLPAGMPLGVTCRERLDSFVTGLFLPLYPVMAGYRTQFTTTNSFEVWGRIELIFIICYVGKLIGSMLASLYFEMPVRDALVVGLMMNIKGITEVAFFYSWGEAHADQAATVEHFSMLMVPLLSNMAATTPLIKFLYNPSARYVARKWRTIQHAKPNRQLQVVTCVHNEDNVPSLLDLLEASNPSLKSPISVTVLHLKELIGQASSLIRPYKRSKRRTNITSSDHIVNAFRNFEQQSEGVVFVSPYVAIAPYVTMHNDVCTLAYNKKAQLIILPFHKQSNGVHEAANHTIRIVNSSVLHRAPCSVAVLVERGVPATINYANHLLQRVLVYFFGGADDREALAYGMRMAGTGIISLTVVLFIRKGEARLNDEVEARLDEEMLMELRDQQVKNSSITYVKKVVADGEGMVEVVQFMSEKFDLLIVGRRKDVECELTRGMLEWIECPELGVVGDLLASTNFGERVTILVVQQQQRVSA